MVKRGVRQHAGQLFFDVHELRSKKSDVFITDSQVHAGCHPMLPLGEVPRNVAIEFFEGSKMRMTVLPGKWKAAGPSSVVSSVARDASANWSNVPPSRSSSQTKIMKCLDSTT